MSRASASATAPFISPSPLAWPAVENLWDGRVEMEVQGSEVSIREMLARIQQQRWINVADMEITEIPCEEERGFKIR